LIPGDVAAFVWRGEILSPLQQFGFYGIQNGDSIIAIQEPADSAETMLRQSQWLRLSLDHDFLEDRLRLVVNERTKSEALRLRDIALMKRELPTKRARRLIQSFLDLGSTGFQRQEFKTVIPPAASELSTAELPRLW
jgi:hypothetical protein